MLSTKLLNIAKRGDGIFLQNFFSGFSSLCDLNIALDGACEGGHRALVDFLVKKIDQVATESDDVKLVWNNGLRGACKGGHRAIVDLMIERGATDWSAGLYCACLNNHRVLVDLMIERGTFSTKNWNDCLYCACKNGHRALVDLMIEKGATDWNRGLAEACRSGIRALVDLMIKRGATQWNWGLAGACLGGHRALVDLMIERGATDWSRIVQKFSDDMRFIAHLLVRIRGQRRHDFIDVIRAHSKDPTQKVLKVYLMNRHFLVGAVDTCVLDRKAKLRAVLLHFVCTDVATWTTRLVGFYQ